MRFLPLLTSSIFCNLSFRYLFVAMLAVLAAAGTSSATFASACRMKEPIFNIAGSSFKVNITFDCVQEVGAGYVEYPRGTVYIGMSLFETGLSADSRPVRAEGTEHFVDPMTIASFDSTIEVELSHSDLPQSASHYVIALWSEKTECIYADAEICFGPYDSDLFPIPIDTFPRPICDIELLESIGFFDWSEQGDPIGHVETPDSIKNVLPKVDCFRGNQSRYGLGVSLKSWRVAPIPRR